jgi:hypothetical protein
MKAIALILLLTATCFANPKTIQGLPLKVTESGMDLIVHFEVGGSSYYKKVYQRPIWAKGASGVTVGIGYDLGYNTRCQIQKDWGDILPKKMVDALKSCAGIKGSASRIHQQRIKYIVNIPLDDAMKVFIKRTVPRFAQLAKTSFKTIEKADPFIQDMMLSQTFNRGASTKGNSRRHVLWQSRASAKGQYYALPIYCRDSKIIWANQPSIRRGIWRRRDAEADHGEGKGKFIQ